MIARPWRLAHPRTAFIAMAIFLAVFPPLLTLIGGDVTLASRIVILALFGLGVDLIFGFTGLLSFGQAAFFGTGGFVAGYLLLHSVPNTLAALAIGTLAAALCGAVIGALSLRQVGVYFAMLTLAFGELFYFLDNSPLRGVTGGEGGITDIPRPSLWLGFTTIDCSSTTATYTFIAVTYFLAYLLMRRIIASPFGRILRAILENPERAAASGHGTLRYKLIAFTIAAAYAGLAGGLFGTLQGSLSPDVFSLDISGEIIVVTVIGGAGTLIGPLVGSFLWLYLQHALQNVGPIAGVPIAGIWKLLLGVIFVLLITGFRRGIVGGFAALLRARSKRVARA
jgi:branched-chain amino acid transport system permease protein